MSQSVARQNTGSEIPQQSWPQEISHEPSMSIGQLVELVKEEFPALSVSKVRYLEEQGLLFPVRTPTGYRRYSLADAARLRFVLVAQRDKYLPLQVIAQQLADLDAGRAVQATQPTSPARMVSSHGQLLLPQPGSTITARELMDLTAASRTLLDDMVKYHLISPDAGGKFPADAVSIVERVMALGRNGIEPRNLRSVKNQALRIAELIDQVVSPERFSRHAISRERGEARATELAEILVSLQTDMIREAVRK